MICFRRCILALLAIAVMLVLVDRYTDINTQLADWMYDFSAAHFPWRDNWFASVVMHRWMKPLFIGLGLIPIAVLLIDSLLSHQLLNEERRSGLKVIALSFVLVPLSVSLLKNLSIHACPWDLQRYGGSLPHLKIFDTLPSGVTPGRCSPAGHASIALWLPSLAVWWMPKSRKAAATVFLIGLLPGLALGWIQQLRGAHFLTHTLWSVWIATLVIVCLLARARYASKNSP